MVVGLPGPASAASCSGLGEGMRGSESILSFSSVRASNGGRRMKLQSAIEFLTTYGFVLIIIAALISLVFLVVGSARTEIPSACASFGGLDCNFLSFYSNVSSRYSVVTLSLSNSAMHITICPGYAKFGVHMPAAELLRYCTVKLVMFIGTLSELLNDRVTTEYLLETLE